MEKKKKMGISPRCLPSRHFSALQGGTQCTELQPQPRAGLGREDREELNLVEKQEGRVESTFR